MQHCSVSRAARPFGHPDLFRAAPFGPRRAFEPGAFREWSSPWRNRNSATAKRTFRLLFPSRSGLWALFFCGLAPYIRSAGSPAMEINDRRNKPFGPGGSTRRLHPSPSPSGWVSAGANQDRRGRKGRVFSRYGSAVIGLCNSCKRQLCSGCSGCVTQFERPSLKS